MLIDVLKQERINQFKQKTDFSKRIYNSLGVIIAESSKESKTPTNEKVISVIKKTIENSKILLEKIQDEIKQSNINDEIIFISQYLPKQLTENEILTILNKINKTTNLNIGLIMKHFKTHYNGQYNGEILSSIAKNFIG